MRQVSVGLLLTCGACVGVRLVVSRYSKIVPTFMDYITAVRAGVGAYADVSSKVTPTSKRAVNFVVSPGSIFHIRYILDKCRQWFCS